MESVFNYLKHWSILNENIKKIYIYGNIFGGYILLDRNPPYAIVSVQEVLYSVYLFTIYNGSKLLGHTVGHLT